MWARVSIACNTSGQPVGEAENQRRLLAGKR